MRPTAPRPLSGPGDADPAARVRRLIGSARERDGSAGLRELDSALARFDAPVDLRIRGGLGTGRRTLAAALRTRRGWRPAVDDLDLLAGAGGPVGCPPDVEVVCLRTAPCRHEEAWLQRTRVHAVLVVATGVDAEDPPRWARGLPAVDARRPGDRSIDSVVSFLDNALDPALGGLAAVRTARLEAELERLAVHDRVGDLAEAALCGLHQGGLHQAGGELHPRGVTGPAPS